MKSTTLCLLVLFQIIASAYGQTGDGLKTAAAPKEFAVELNAIQTSLVSHKAGGINFNFKYFPHKRFATGAYLLFSARQMRDTFTYSIARPIIQFYEGGWTNQYNFLQTSRVRMDINLVNAFSQARLGDNAIKEKQHKYAPKEVASNYFYILEPGTGFSYKFLSGKDNTGLWLHAMVNYRFVFGNCKYATTKDFTGWLFGIGIAVNGFDVDKLDAKTGAGK